MGTDSKLLKIVLIIVNIVVVVVGVAGNINTGHPEPYTVFCYDENAETVENIGDSFLDYMKSLVAFYGKLEPKKIICRGDMITI